MDDRTLLELAAKAAGYSVRAVSGYEQGGTVSFYMEPSQLYWNPIADDGDALRLAVKLGIAWTDDYTYPDGERVAMVSCAFGNTLYGDSEPMGDDPYAATRRAITRAAAEIGRGMK
jgi:hypothetical protein